MIRKKLVLLFPCCAMLLLMVYIVSGMGYGVVPITDLSPACVGNCYSCHMQFRGGNQFVDE